MHFAHRGRDFHLSKFMKWTTRLPMWSELDAFSGGFASVIHISSPRPSVILLIATGPLVGQSWCFNQGYTGLQPGSSSPHCRLCWLSITPMLRVFSVPLVQFGQLLLPGSVSQLSSFPCVFQGVRVAGSSLRRSH